MLDEKNYWLAFSVFSGIGPIKFKLLLKQFGSAKDAWRTSSLELSKVIGEKLTEKFDKFRNEFSINGYTKRLTTEKVSILTLTDKVYPRLLLQIRNPPFVLYVKGDTEILNQDTKSSLGQKAQNDPSWLADRSGKANYIAIVGARKTTEYGREVTRILTEDLVERGLTIVSGLAIGIDAVSHQTAIKNGKTIAVLGCGVDCCYPLANKSIYNSIVGGKGAVISEMPLGTRPTRGSFPARNRIIAGLSDAVLVTEGTEDSGSLITAEYALRFKRLLFAVPGPITSNLSKGPYKLIEKGAKLAIKAEDIIKELGIISTISTKSTKSIISIKGETKEENMILEILQSEPLHFDQIVRLTGLQSSEIGSILSIMEVKGLVRSLEMGMFKIADS